MSPARPGSSLTAREIEVVSALFQVDDVKAAAHELGISARAVQMHHANVKARTGLTDRELVLLLFPPSRPAKRPRPASATLPIWP